MKLEKELGLEKFDGEKSKAAINIQFTGSWLFNLLNRVIKKCDLTVPQYNVLRAISISQEPVTMKDIASKMIDKNSNVSRLIDKLEKKKFVMRKEVPNDGRIKHIVITSEGQKTMNEARNVLEQETHKLFAIVTDSDLKILNELLDKIRG